VTSLGISFRWEDFRRANPQERVCLGNLRFYVEFNARRIGAGLGDDRSAPSRLNFDGIIFEPRRYRYGFLYADNIKKVLTKRQSEHVSP
jgi:hypothetical protein